LRVSSQSHHNPEIAAQFFNADQGLEEAIVAVIVEDGTEKCTVGFLLRSWLGIRGRFVDRFAQVTELYADSTSTQKRRKNSRNSGTAECILLDAIPSFQ
jgi:hypothetical protein